MTKQFRYYESVRTFARSLNLKYYNEWSEYCKSSKKLDYIPTTPLDIYKEWKKK